jgi:hypothetical protein
MPDALITAAPWIALATGVLAIALLVVAGLRTWRTWRRARVTQEAAAALMDVHMSTLDESIRQLDGHAGAFADDGERLAEALAELRADVAHLRWMLGRIPAERERLVRELYELVLPTGGGERAERGERVRSGGDDG